MERHYRSIFVSDIHFGTRDCKADELNNFLKHHTCDTLYLVGDIIDAWKIQQNKKHYEGQRIVEMSLFKIKHYGMKKKWLNINLL